MVPVSDAVRKIVMERDRGECQFWCGGQPATEISHFKHQGVGGLPADHSRNRPPNLAASCSECHRRLPPNGNWRWIEFSGNNDKVGTMEILDPDGHVVSGADLWFYNRWRKQAAIMAAQSLQTVATIDCTIGEMMHDLRDGAEFLAGARSFEEHASGLGWDSIKANKIADVFEWARSLECGWPRDVNYAKMELLYGVDWGDRSPSPFVESAAAGDSYSTLQADLIREGLREHTPRIYLLCSPEVLDGGPFGPGVVTPMLIRTREEEKLLESAVECGLAVLKLNAFKGRLRYKRGKAGGVFDVQTGRQVTLFTLEEWLGVQ